MTPHLQAVIRQKLSNFFSNVGSLAIFPAGGGSINQCYRIGFGDNNFFGKLNSASQFPQLFQKEADGLKLLAATKAIKTPAVLDCFEADGHQILLLEWVEPGERTETFWKSFGEGLAALHQFTNERFGLHEDNYMGNVPQRNRMHQTWADFFARERIRPVMKACFDRKLLSKEHRKSFEKLEAKYAELFNHEKPSLVHGDLWAGNLLCSKSGEPVLIDPAVFYGHRSADLAMTTLFSGFAPSFYEAYHHHLPLPKNHQEQWAVCHLYPLLIHLYLFGTQYLPQIERVLGRFA